MTKLIRSLRKSDKHNTTMVGRWSVKKNKKSENIVVYWANNDHCGSCGNVMKNLKFLNKKENK